MYYVYIIKSAKEPRYYIGCTADLVRRLREHNSGYSKSTKPYQPWDLVYSEVFHNKNDAYKREWYLKHPVGYNEKRNILDNLDIRRGG